MSDTPTSTLSKASALAGAGQADDAIAVLETGLTVSPADFAGWMLLSRLHYETGDFQKAVAAAQKMERADPLGSEFARIQQSIQSRRFEAAREVADAMLTQYPGHPRAVYTLVHLARARGDHETAQSVLEESFQHAPANPVLRELYVTVLEDTGSYGQAIAAARHLYELDPSLPSGERLLAILLRYGQSQEALALCDELNALAQGDNRRRSQISLARGQLLRILGDREASIAAFHASLDQNPAQAGAWWGLADLKTYTFSETDEQAIGELLMSATGTRGDKAQAAFALARASEAYGDPNRTMAWYEKANGFQSDHVKAQSAGGASAFDPVQFSEGVRRIQRAFTRDALARQADTRAEGPTPIFILGLPRSGSTLLEQMLASHSAIEGTMELPVLPAIKRRAHRLCAEESGRDYLASIHDLSLQTLSNLGQQYVDEAAIFRPEGAPFFIDKLPHNFEHVGLIHKILPHAIVIDIRRNPLDCGLSLFRQYFAQGVSYSYDLADIGAYYNGYLALMDQWDEVVPSRVVRVVYEDLVASPETQIRRVLDAIGVPFEDACLTFHETRRAIRTASSEQVRQPLNASGIGQWRRYETGLGRLKDSLGQATLSRFEDHLTPLE